MLVLMSELYSESMLEWSKDPSRGKSMAHVLVSNLVLQTVSWMVSNLEDMRDIDLALRMEDMRDIDLASATDVTMD